MRNPLPVAGTSNRRALGTDPDLEKLARRWRKAGGTVVTLKSNHLMWELGSYRLRTGLTMNRHNIRNARRKLEQALDA